MMEWKFDLNDMDSKKKWKELCDYLRKLKGVDIRSGITIHNYVIVVYIERDDKKDFEL